MSSTRIIGRITVAIGTGIAAVAISLTAHDSAAATRPLCQDDVDCHPLPTSTSRRPTTVTSTLGPPPTTSSWNTAPPTTWTPTPTASSSDLPPACPVYKPCAEVPFS
jgi:hypothetical protein